MRGQDDRQAYDRGTSLFSPDGRLYQVEYAREAVKRGGASVGVRAVDGVVLAAERRIRSSLLEPRSIEKLHKIDDHNGVASAGHVADARQLVEEARQTAQVEQLRYEEPITPEQLTVEVSEHIQEYTQAGHTRPFGAALLVGGYVDGKPQLFETDPSGTPYEWQATAIGGSSDEMETTLEAEYDPEMGIDAAYSLAVSVLTDEEDPDPENVAVAIIDEDGYRTLEQDEIESVL
ncbi:archaeal proteasome endopeptidase complex subunit alpha [Halocatena marina]|uniref:Proteasome subunit alpha n=1 Tax=Halocatena marina TaxID=2934937 RepID=A0ABD5YTJ8_9EURY|nr:archaeal proteasome endopeptidase complex subunit alpha [Halocatena marina]